jgi:predicted RNase H-like HicB family nuclease
VEKYLVAAIDANFSNVSAPKTPAIAERQALPEDKFLAWLDEDSTTALISRSHGQYYAHCVEFGIAGSGATKEEAVDDAVNLLMRYLVVSFSEGRPYQDSKKSPPARLRLRSWYLYVRTKLLRGIKPLSRLGWLISVPTTNRDSQRLAH